MRPAAGHYRSNAGEISFPNGRNDHGMTGSYPTIGHMNQIATGIRISAHHRHQVTVAHAPDSPVTRLKSDLPQHHTHVQQVALSLLADRSGGSGC